MWPSLSFESRRNLPKLLSELLFEDLGVQGRELEERHSRRHNPAVEEVVERDGLCNTVELARRRPFLRLQWLQIFDFLFNKA